MAQDYRCYAVPLPPEGPGKGCLLVGKAPEAEHSPRLQMAVVGLHISSTVVQAPVLHCTRLRLPAECQLQAAVVLLYAAGAAKCI